MFKIFRKMRQKYLHDKKISKYLLYASGEIILVVIGILIALQINTKNDQRLARAQEIHYLKNIKSDLKGNIAELEHYIKKRNESIQAANLMIEYFNGKKIEDYDAFNALPMPIYNWQKFYQNNKTFQELVSSGNLSLITNDKIKYRLLDIEGVYKKLQYDEEHYRFDSEETFYKPIYSTMDMEPMLLNYTYRVSNGKLGKLKTLTQQYFEPLLKNIEIKNGFMLTAFMFDAINKHMVKMKLMSEELIVIIDQEIYSYHSSDT